MINKQQTTSKQHQLTSYQQQITTHTHTHTHTHKCQKLRNVLMCVNAIVLMLSGTRRTATIFAHSGNTSERLTSALENIMADSQNTAECRTSALGSILADAGNTAVSRTNALENILADSGNTAESCLSALEHIWVDSGNSAESCTSALETILADSQTKTSQQQKTQQTNNKQIPQNNTRFKISKNTLHSIKNEKVIKNETQVINKSTTSYHSELPTLF